MTASVKGGRVDAVEKSGGERGPRGGGGGMQDLNDCFLGYPSMASNGVHLGGEEEVKWMLRIDCEVMAYPVSVLRVDSGKAMVKPGHNFRGIAPPGLH